MAKHLKQQGGQQGKRPQKQKQYIDEAPKQKKLSRRIRLWVGVLSITILISVFYISQSVVAVMESKETLKHQVLLLEQEKQRQSVLESDLLKLEDKEYIKQYAREKFQYTTEDEILFRLPKEEVIDGTTANNS